MVKISNVVCWALVFICLTQLPYETFAQEIGKSGSDSAATVAITADLGKDNTRGGVMLKGVVLDEHDIPVSGATVMIWSAGVKHGYSTYCPGCYADCGKRDNTNINGEFAVPSVSRDLKFRLLVVKEGFEPTFVGSVDPIEKDVIAKIQPRQIPKDTMQVVRGRVVDTSGNPVPDAIVEPDMVWFRNTDGQIGGRGGAVKGLDPLAVSNSRGEFEIVYTVPVVRMTLTIRARGLAAAHFEDLAAGDNRHVLALHVGSTVQGRLLHFNQPVANAEIGLMSQSRTGDGFHEERIGTKSDGTFSFPNVPTGTKWFVYAKMESTVESGVTDAFELATVRDGETIDVGDMKLERGHHLSGRVVLSDGKSIPEGMQMGLSCERSWDGQSVVLDTDGRFTFRNLRTDTYSLSPSVKGYKLSESNPNLAWTIEGLINEDIDDFVIVLDPGEEDFAGRYGGKFRDQPLRSASVY